MAFNQQRQEYCPVYAQSHSEIQSVNEFIPETMEKINTSFKKRILFERTPNSENMNAKKSNHEETSLISEAKIYALKKRLLLPVWLLEGVLLVLGTKESWFESIACTRLGKIFACPSHINVKTLIPFFLVWHELVSKLFSNQSQDTYIKLQINKYITGTKKDIQEISKEIENIFSSPLKLFEIKLSKKTKTYAMSKKGSLNFIRHAQLENDVDGVWLTLNLTNSFKEICYPPELKNSIQFKTDNIVSINPVVIRSMGPRASLKKILNYLFLEFSKQDCYINNSNWNSFQIDCKKISHFHKDFLSTAPAFYDHGVLGWNNCAPNKKISEIKSEKHSLHQKTEIICSWQLSEQIKEAYEIEHAISEKVSQNQNAVDVSQSLFPIPPDDELRKVRTEKQIKKTTLGKELIQKTKFIDKRETSLKENIYHKPVKKVITQTLFDDGILIKKNTMPSTPPSSFTQSIHTTNLGDHEFLVLVSEFYESLKPMQKRAFERDRKGMTPEQFKAYMSSILQRKKVNHL